MRSERVVLEVIATTVADAMAAARGGADRLELITATGEGGLTPSIGMIEAVVAAMRAVAVKVAAGTPKKGTNSASFSPKSMSGSMK